MVGSRLLPCVVALAACATNHVAPKRSARAGVPVDELRAAVFEVVVPKYEPAGVEYAEPLPVHLLPKHVREDAYHSIGTAFTMDGTTFVSASHVFAVEDETQFGERRLRAADGAVYEIDQFVRYSGVRDLVVFTLRGAPTAPRPLVRGATPEIGSTVYTVGNAQGEGLSVRGGNVASFTPEPLDSAWEFIRYSAPTSPGNSGGPLLDEEGRVVGIVVRKNDNENLNYAVPVEELDRLSASRADFYGRFAEFESGERLVDDLRYEADLPADYGTLAAHGTQGHHDAIVAQRAAFEAKFRDRIFPTAPELRSYLREQGKYYYPAEVVRDASGRWSTGEPTTSTFEVGPGQILYVGKTGDYFYAVLERPDDVPLATFLDQPERVMEAMVRLLPFTRTFAGVEVRITAYGPPHRRDAWQDALGRPWISATWRLWDDQSSALHCTTYPRGLACVIAEGPTSQEPRLLMYARINAVRWTLSYDGRVKDWVEYLALDPALRPTFLSGEVTKSGTEVGVSLGAFRVTASDAGLSDSSLIYAEVEYASLSPPAVRVSSVAIVTAPTRGLGFRVDRLVEPLSDGSRDWWEGLVGLQPPYDGKIVRNADVAEMMVVQETSPVTLSPDTGVEARILVKCWTTDVDAVPDKALTKACAAFRKTVAVSSD